MKSNWIQRILLGIQKADRRLLASVMFLISAAILGALFYSQKDILLRQKWELRWQFVVLAFAVYTLTLALVTQVWASIMNTLGTSLPFTHHLRNYVFSNLAKRIPGTIWYIAGRGYLYQREGIPAALVTVASSLEFGVAVLSGILVSLVFALPQMLARHTNNLLIVIVAILCIGAVQPRFIRWLLNKLHVEQKQAVGYPQLLAWIATYSLAWILTGVIVFELTNALTPLPLSDLPTVIGSYSLAGVISSAFFFFPSNLGVTEVSLSLLLTQVMPASFAVIVAVLTRVATTLFEVLWVLAGLGSLRLSERQASDPNSPE